ncbi:MAG: hydrogenase iron-sulfur subunit, partial [Deltaproteobacteria bacterium]|nr:hydrogenase iron-sulfur subunit [Deltaproteobacteria bacterium]
REERCRVSYDDESLGRNVAISPDLLVLEEAYRPAKETAHLGHILGIHLDGHGFFQGDNVYNLPIFTNRTGIWVAGSARGPLSLEEGLQEAKATALEVSKLLGEGKQRAAENRVQLDPRKCAICLTCYRLCPHRAVSYVNRRPAFSDLACRACGICAAECPMDAIQMHAYTDDFLKSQIRDLNQTPSILAFCCQNSAHEAAHLAALSGVALPATMKLIKVPCAGKVDGDYILSAFRSGADGVMVLACHHESCKSIHGSHMAQWRVEALHAALEESGLEKERLLFGTLAPGMMSDFVKMSQEMEKRVQARGASAIHISPSAEFS